jgi:hypothetical protein
MRGLSGRVMVLLVLAAAIAADDAAARTIRRLCRDGVIADRTDRSGRLTTSCDVDQQCDGTCSFAIPVCDATTCRTQTFTVPVRTTRPERMALTPGAAPAKLMLRCRPTPRSLRCIAPTTTSTTTIDGSTTTIADGGGGGGQIPRQTTTTRGLIHASTTSTLTTTSTPCTCASTTTTSLVPVPCQGDFACDGFSSACAIGFCGVRQLCEQTCVCIRPDHERTCDVDEAATCLTPADCPSLIGNRCHVCYLNLCVAASAQSCF